jgi:hypothetical protein
VNFIDRSRQYEKRRLKNFWKKKWIPGRSPEIWVNCLRINSNIKSSGLIRDAIVKLHLEKKITLEEGQNLWKMIESPDDENLYTAISILQGLKPKMFYRRGDKVIPEPKLYVHNSNIFIYNMPNGHGDGITHR